MVFLRVGAADPRVNQISQYYGGGLIYQGLLPERPTDYFGIGVATARNSRHFKRAQRRDGTPVKDAEIALGMTYAINVTPELLVQPDIQYIINPGMDPSIDNALVIGVRLGMHIHWFESEGS